MTASIVFRHPQGAKQTRSGLNNRARGSAPVVAGLGGSPTSKMERSARRGGRGMGLRRSAGIACQCFFVTSSQPVELLKSRCEKNLKYF